MTNLRLAHLIKTIAAVLFAISTLSSTPALAEGGNDPIPGIDVILKKDVSSKPVAPLIFTDGQLEKLKALGEKEQAQFMAKLVVEHVYKQTGAEVGFDEAYEQLINKIRAGRAQNFRVEINLKK